LSNKALQYIISPIDASDTPVRRGGWRISYFLVDLRGTIRSVSSHFYLYSQNDGEHLLFCKI